MLLNYVLVVLEARFDLYVARLPINEQRLGVSWGAGREGKAKEFGGEAEKVFGVCGKVVYKRVTKIVQRNVTVRV